MSGLHSEVKIGFTDDIILSGEMSVVEKHVTVILEASAETGLHLSTAKCEIIMRTSQRLRHHQFLHTLRVEKSEMTLLGAPVITGKAQDRAITDKTVNSSAGPLTVCHYSMAWCTTNTEE